MYCYTSATSSGSNGLQWNARWPWLQGWKNGLGLQPVWLQYVNPYIFHSKVYDSTLLMLYISLPCWDEYHHRRLQKNGWSILLHSLCDPFSLWGMFQADRSVRDQECGVCKILQGRQRFAQVFGTSTWYKHHVSIAAIIKQDIKLYMKQCL